MGDRWFVDETYVKVAGKWRYVYRAVDQYGQIIDVLVAARRDLRAAQRFFATALRAHGEPVEVVTDRAPALRAAIEGLLPAAFHNTPPSKPTTASKATTDGSKPDSVPCEGSHATVLHAWSSVVTR